MYTRIYENTAMVSPERAVSYLSINTFPGQRPLNEEKVARYVDYKESGRMRTVAIDIAVFNDDKVLVNGQHVLSMILASKKPHHAIITHYKCESKEDMWVLFSSFDTHSTRTEKQIMHGAKGMFSGDIAEIHTSVLSVCGSALFIIGDGSVEPQWCTCYDKATKPKLVSRNPDAVKFVNSLKNPHTASLLRVGVVAAIIATWRKNKAYAAEFWRKVLNCDSISMNTPHWKLHKALSSSAAAGARGRDGQQWDYAQSICWWNNFRNPEGSREKVNFGKMKSLPNPI